MHGPGDDPFETVMCIGFLSNRSVFVGDIYFRNQNFPPLQAFISKGIKKYENQLLYAWANLQMPFFPVYLFIYLFLFTKLQHSMCPRVRKVLE